MIECMSENKFKRYLVHISIKKLMGQRNLTIYLVRATKRPFVPLNFLILFKYFIPVEFSSHKNPQNA